MDKVTNVSISPFENQLQHSASHFFLHECTEKRAYLIEVLFAFCQSLLLWNLKHILNCGQLVNVGSWLGSSGRCCLLGLFLYRFGLRELLFCFLFGLFFYCFGLRELLL